MGKPNKAKAQPEKQKQTLLFIKPKPTLESTVEPIAEPITESIAELPEPLTVPVTSSKPVIEQTQEILQETPTQTATQQPEEIEQSSSLFQAIGMIAGTVRFDNEGKSWVKVGNKEYPLFWVPNKNKKKAYQERIQYSGVRIQYEFCTTGG